MKIVIEGNIGSGKSTILKKIEEETRIPIFLEPIRLWTFLEDFYDDIPRWSFAFSVQILMCFQKWKNNEFDGLYERSPTSCRHIFTQMHRDNDTMTQKELDLFDKLYELFSWKSDHTIYVRTDPHVCFERMKKRNRSCENDVPLSYLSEVHEKHESVLSIVPNVHIVDGNKDIEDVYNDVLAIVTKLIK